MSGGYIVSIPQRFLLGGALVSARLCRLPEQEVHQPSKQELHQPSKNDNYSKDIGTQVTLLVHLRQVHPLEGVRRPIGFRPLSDDIPITIKGRKLHIRVRKPHISVYKISENPNVVLTLVISALSICFMCARTKHHYNIVWANGIIASF